MTEEEFEKGTKDTFCHQDEKELIEYKINFDALNEELYNDNFISYYYELEEEFYKYTKRHNIDMRLFDWLEKQ